MASEARDIFFSDKNLEFTYGVVVQNVEKKTGANIQKHPSFRTVFNKMATSVYEKTHNESRNLITLNTNLIDRSSVYIQQYINKQRSGGLKGEEASPSTDYNGRPLSTQASFNQNLGFSIQAPKPNLNADIARLQQERNGVQSIPNNYMPPVQYSAASTQDIGKPDNSDLKAKYNSFLSSRDSDLTTNTGNKGLSYVEADTDRKINIDPMAQLRAAAQKPQGVVKSQGYALQPFTLSPDFLSNLEQSNDVPLYNNIQTLEQQDGQDTMKILEQYQKERSNQFTEFQRLQKEQQSNADSSKVPIEQTLSELSINNANVFGNSEANRIASVLGDPRKLEVFDKSVTENLVNATTDHQMYDNDIGMEGDTSVNRILKDGQRKSQPKLVDRDHYISINSIDRHWQQTTSTETRYSYKVNFDPAPGQLNIGVNRNFRNVVAVELVNVIVPHDNSIIPFDNRIYLDNACFPYLLLEIEELDGVYRGTNSNNDRSFAHLLFDKEHNSDVLSTTYISSDTTPTGTMFSKQFARGFIRYSPGYFEKKTFYNNPIASLNRMTINIVDPYGNPIDVQPDVLPISTIAYEPVTDHAIKGTVGFPNDNTGTTRSYIKITTGKYFCNRIFRIGDRIHISGVVSTVSKFQQYINRPQGHFIINLDTEVDTAGNYNKGFINNIYISTPGELTANGQTVDSTTDIVSLGVGTITYTNAFLINENLQTHMLLKVTTREADTYQTLNSINV
jgi:hypothetical protein